jgi:hypothetical protein
MMTLQRIQNVQTMHAQDFCHHPKQICYKTIEVVCIIGTYFVCMVAGVLALVCLGGIALEVMDQFRNKVNSELKTCRDENGAFKGTFYCAGLDWLEKIIRNVVVPNVGEYIVHILSFIMKFFVKKALNRYI